MIFDKERNKRSFTNIFSILTNLLYQISCPFLQTLFIKYLVHFNKRSLTNIFNIFDKERLKKWTRYFIKNVYENLKDI
jgi:hypothetical protein